MSHETFPSALLGADSGADKSEAVEYSLLGADGGADTVKAVGHSVLRADSGDLSECS